jgi:hypothetical protein
MLGAPSCAREQRTRVSCLVRRFLRGLPPLCWVSSVSRRGDGVGCMCAFGVGFQSRTLRIPRPPPPFPFSPC